jgi:chaperone modulatory protein CbpM
MNSNFDRNIVTQLKSINVEGELTELTLNDLCQACESQAEVLMELFNEGIIESMSTQPDPNPAQWRFTGLQLHRAKVAIRLHRALGINFAGAALAIQLLDEIDRIKSTMR